MASQIIVHSLKFFPISCILAIAIYLQHPSKRMAYSLLFSTVSCILAKRLDLQIVYQMKLLNIIK
jgi:hypothetical protein